MRPQLDLPAGTYTVSQLGSEIKAAVNQIFSGVWLAGEVQRPSLSRPGHLYFDLVEKGYGDQVRARLSAAIFSRDLQRIRRELKRAGLEIRAGSQLRCYAQVDLYPVRGQLQVVVRDVDAVFTLGDLERRRRETLQWLGEQGLLDCNSLLDVPPLPLRIGLVASRGSAGYEDFLATLRASGFAFEVALCDVAVQGAGAENGIRRALRQLSGQARSASLDVVAMVRGGGARSDLAVFDARAVAEEVAHSPLPVLTGLGHQIDRSVVDHVAHTAFKTPTSVAEFLVQRCADSEQLLERVAVGTREAALRRVERSWRFLDRATHRLTARSQAVSERMAEVTSVFTAIARQAQATASRSRQQLASIQGRLVPPARRLLRRQNEHLAAMRTRAGREAERRLSAVARELDSRERVMTQLDPVRVLARGFSVTRSASGRALRDASKVATGELLVTQLHEGRLLSIVEQSAAETRTPEGE